MFALEENSIDTHALRQKMSDPMAGAFLAFEGWVRDHNEGKAVSLLAYESYAELAQKEGERILMEAMDKFDIHKAACVHRVGQLEIGDVAVWAGVSASHRDAAFQACRYVIDEVKKRVPIWKNERYPDGDSGWINAEYEAFRKA